MVKTKPSAYIHVRVPLETKERLIELADANGGISKYLRHIIDKMSGREPLCSKAGNGGGNAHSASWHLSRIGNSLNQMAYTANRANLSGKVDNKLIKEMIKELIYLNIKIDTLIEKSEKSEYMMKMEKRERDEKEDKINKTGKSEKEDISVKKEKLDSSNKFEQVKNSKEFKK